MLPGVTCSVSYGSYGRYCLLRSSAGVPIMTRPSTSALINDNHSVKVVTNQVFGTVCETSFIMHIVMMI